MLKIVIVGPESTGKSTLTERLARHYNTLWVPEYAREYLLKNGIQYTFEDLLEIAKGQIRTENEASLQVKNNLLFIDTNMYVMKVWCQFVFNNCHEWVVSQLKERTYDLYLLCNVDLPWVKDEMREYPDLATRQKLYNIYKELMENQQTPWVDISGSYEQRFEIAVSAVDRLLKEREPIHLLL